MQKPLNRSRWVCGLGWAEGTMYYMVLQIPHAKGKFEGEWCQIVKYMDLLS